jgi:hypothetical protein
LQLGGVGAVSELPAIYSGPNHGQINNGCSTVKCSKRVNRMTTVCVAILGVLIVIAAPASLVSDSSQSPGPSIRSTYQAVDQKDLIWWLPADTESVAAARGPFSIPNVPNETGEKNDQEWFTKKASQADIRVEFEKLPLELLYDLDLSKALSDYTVAYAMQGSRHFREPNPGSEVTEYEGCSIVVFERNLDGLESTIIRMLGWKGASHGLISGTQVLIRHVKSNDAEQTYLLGFPKPNILLIANNRKYLGEVLERMALKKAPRALPDQLPEWKFLDANARFWGIRHYDPTQAKKDPTSPLGGDSAYVQGNPNAIGVLFALDPKSERSLVITSISSDEAKTRAEASKGQVISEPQDGVKFEVKLRNPAPGVLEEIYTLDRSSTLDYCLLAIQSALGRGMNF